MLHFTHSRRPRRRRPHDQRVIGPGRLWYVRMCDVMRAAVRTCPACVCARAIAQRNITYNLLRKENFKPHACGSVGVVATHIAESARSRRQRRRWARSILLMRASLRSSALELFSSDADADASTTQFDHKLCYYSIRLAVFPDPRENPNNGPSPKGVSHYIIQRRLIIFPTNLKPIALVKVHWCWTELARAVLRSKW